jgi:hypothetical protein
MLASSRTRDLNRFEIEPLQGSALGDVATFLQRWQRQPDQESSIQDTVQEDVLDAERRLRWLLVDNPLARHVSQHGLCIRDASGALMGLLLSFPGAFLAGDQRRLGLGSGSFFVEPPTRGLGFYLFKRYLNSPGYSFFFSTTCNANSTPLWMTAGGGAVPNSDTEYVVPLKLEVMLPAFLTRSTSSTLAADIARVFGRCADPVRQLLTRPSGELVVEPSVDWEKLAALSRRHRQARWITTERSAAYLEWRYGPHAHNQPFDICVFRDKRGQEGWFALGTVLRGRQRQIQGCVLLDAVWPREAMGFRDVLWAILQRVAFKADAIFLQPRPGLDYGECGRWIMPCKLEAPRIVALGRRGEAPLEIESLDLVPADGDGAF